MVIVGHTEINWVISGILFLFFLIVGICLFSIGTSTSNKNKSYILAFSGICSVVLGIGSIFLGIIPSSETIYDNPMNVKFTNNNTGFEINKDVLTNKISKTINAGNIELSETKFMFHTLHDGDSVDFTATKDNDEIYGKVKFTKTEMIVTVLNSESDNYKVTVK